MAITIEQRWSTGTKETAEQPRGELSYIVKGTDDLDAAQSALAAYVPSSWDGTYLNSAAITDRLAEEIWSGIARYGQRSGSQFAQAEFETSFEFSAITQRWNRSIATVATYGDAPDFKTGVGYDFESKQFEGYDRYIPTGSFSETHYLPDASVNAGYRRRILLMVGTVNGAPFRGYARGECIFLGVTGSRQGNEQRWQLRYMWAVSPNVQNIQVGDLMVTAKEGWHYLWILFRPEIWTEGEHPALVKVPRAAYVEQIYEYSNYAMLGIGTG